MAAALIVILGIVTAIRVRLLNFPLQRDEGEFAYAGQLLLQGISPYKAAYTVTLKLPGTFIGYALIMAIFGQTSSAIHAGVILINLASAVLVFLMARRIFGDPAGVVATGTYALLSIIPVTMGLAAHATHFVMLFALAGILLLQDLSETTSLKRIFFAGLLLGLSFIMKQTGIAFGLFGASWVAWVELSQKSRQWRRLLKRLGFLLMGGSLPFILTCIIVTATGDLGHFWFWAFQYAAEHGLVFTLRSGLISLFDHVSQQFAAAPGLWSLAILGLILVFCDQALRSWRFFIAALSFFSFLAVCPGWYFRGHYFIQLLPAAGLLAATAFYVATNFLSRQNSRVLRAVPVLIFAVAAA
ncbi:MAG TPA: glycosyltransferase family 39 protein, partial [Verrucomicrobiae bacterium]|nr:glycosyltransferase family 39 protein [Verrucomicrobiae bacterium]